MLSRLFYYFVICTFSSLDIFKRRYTIAYFYMVIIGMSLYEFYKMLKDKGYEVANRIGMGLGLFSACSNIFSGKLKKYIFHIQTGIFLNRLIMIWVDL